ncbi:hypothetical protein ACTFOB_22165 [Bacillus cereus group sp. MYBK79-1]|uniref:hypothetical protein n=1 Tax=unclassified Bacillus cereus group TaxID=2750818 RepID=UPI003F7A43EA
MKNYIGLVAAISIFILSIVFLYFNPYSKQELDKGVYITVFFMFLFPSFLAVIAAVARHKVFMIICSIWMLPGTLYPALMGSKTPTSKFKGSKEVRWGINCP